MSIIKTMSGEVAKGLSLRTIVSFLESFAPKQLAEPWDNTGLLVEPQTATAIRTVMLTNDLTEDVIEEAVDKRTELIISYHPPIFSPLKSITTSHWKGRVIGRCLENKIAVYSPHTSWDSVPGGVNDWLAGGFQTESVRPIVRSEVEGAGAGRLCTLTTAITLKDAVDRVKTLTDLSFIKLALARGATLGSMVSTVGICAGSGSSVLRGVPADLYLTGEMPHHDLLEAVHSGASVILCNHSDSERGYLHQFARKLAAEYTDLGLNVLVSEKDRDPLVTV